MNRFASIMLAGVGLLAATAAQAGFINGGFEDGNANGWTQGGGYRGNIYNGDLTPGMFLPGDGGIRSSIITTGTVDPRVGAALGSTVYNGNHSYRVENTDNGGYASVLQQTVTNYTDANIFFAWKAVLEGAHGIRDAATMIITLTDLTTGLDLIHREYNAANSGGGVDAKFSTDGTNFFTAEWQIEQLIIDTKLSGHDFMLSILAADCELTGHYGYVYVDGFGEKPPVETPEPAMLGLLGVGILGVAMGRRRKKA